MGKHIVRVRDIHVHYVRVRPRGGGPSRPVQRVVGARLGHAGQGSLVEIRFAVFP